MRDGTALFLDDKAVSGMKLYSRFWPGRVRCIFREGPSGEILYGSWYNSDLLPFEVEIIPGKAPTPDVLLSGAAVVLASGDHYLDLPLADQCKRLGVRLVFGIEYVLRARLWTIALSDLPLFKRLKSMVWSIKTELTRRRAFVRADALQANGTPAAETYAAVNRAIHPYFDTRLSARMVASPRDIAVKSARRAAEARGGFASQGRLERMKGADHLVPMMERLVAGGIDFRFDVFGRGSLSGQLRDAALRIDLAPAPDCPWAGKF